ncbi:ATP-dependent DNA helicase sgs1 [Puccinia graminis f. sp. tritici]|nr:ATP-dependent DNA helicase sgs1 [Puccinia graminis f. sp. tritici]
MHLGPKAEFIASVFFGQDQARAIVGSIDQIRRADVHNTGLLETLIGGQCFHGQVEFLDQAISEWMDGDYYLLHLRQTADLNRFIETEGIRVREAMASELAILLAQSHARREAEKAKKAATKAAAKAEVAAQKVAERMAMAQDKAQERALLAAEKAAERSRVAEAKKAAKLLATRVRATAKAGLDVTLAQGRSVSRVTPQGHDGITGVNGRTLRSHERGCIANPNTMTLEMQRGVEKGIGRKEAGSAADDEMDRFDKTEEWSNRRAAADANRHAVADGKAQGIKRRREELAENRSVAKKNHAQRQASAVTYGKGVEERSDRGRH